ncbi:MAG: hypothetical protein WCG50_14195 [Rhodoferax sp.]|uniref:hypothetical protein n=1 Tax=Rhodoferax sp. TaxID=50421 RepID=UPI003017205C
MRLRLLLRRLTVSAPRMAVRSALPWPFRWAVAAIVLGFCAAMALWAFEFGKDIAGLDKGTKEQLKYARVQLSDLSAEVLALKDERNKAQSVANTVGTLMTTEAEEHQKMTLQLKQLQAENQGLRGDLAVFEKMVLSCKRKL